MRKWIVPSAVSILGLVLGILLGYSFSSYQTVDALYWRDESYKATLMKLKVLIGEGKSDQAVQLIDFALKVTGTTERK